MSEYINPHYYPEKLDLVMLDFADEEVNYAFDYLAFWKDKQGNVYSASDSGCSCPSPFEDYEGRTTEEVIQKLERVKDFDHAVTLFNEWNKGYERQKTKARLTKEVWEAFVGNGISKD